MERVFWGFFFSKPSHGLVKCNQKKNKTTHTNDKKDHVICSLQLAQNPHIFYSLVKKTQHLAHRFNHICILRHTPLRANYPPPPETTANNLSKVCVIISLLLTKKKKRHIKVEVFEYTETCEICGHLKIGWKKTAFPLRTSA